MVSSPKNNATHNTQKSGGHTAFLHGLLPRVRGVAIAVSGGLDSMALLHAAWQLMPQLHVFHVHHDLSNEADAWLAHVAQFCAARQIEFDSRRLDARTRRNAQSIEDWARQGRYAALNEMAQAHGVREVWLAQHQDDQIETYLLQQQRGAGARGLSAMPAVWTRDGVTWQRPWLNVTRAQIADYVHEHAIAHVHDASNDDLRFARNRVRVSVRQMNATQRQAVLAQVNAAQQQHAQETAWAHTILAQHHAPHRAEIGEVARLKRLHNYSDEQQAIVLRTWLAHLGCRMPTRAALNELIKQLNHARADQHMCWQHADGVKIARFQDWIVAAQAHNGWFLTPELQQWIAQEHLKLQSRQGGERFRVHPHQSRMSLKDAYQKHGVAPMLRAHLPLIYRDDQLIYVVGVGHVYD
ncbi:MAG: tRNA lysidine(34) synthetase TilS [Formosimonas sp.]